MPSLRSLRALPLTKVTRSNASDLGDVVRKRTQPYPLGIVIRMIAVTILLATCSLVPFAATQEASTDSSRPVVEKVSPVYPQIARSGNLSGTVKLRVTVAPDGKVQDVEVVGGSPVFVQAASASVSKWKWAKSTQESKVVVQVNFSRAD
jgi:TonB family protein